MSGITKLSKDPYESLDYTADYTDELDAISDTVASSLWIIPSASVNEAGTTSIELSDAVTPDYSVTAPAPKYESGTSGAVSQTTKTSKVFIKGGTLDATYRIMNRITTAGGRKYARVFDLYIQRKGC